LEREQTALLGELREPLYPARISSCQDTVLGYPALSEDALGWLAYLYRKVGFGGKWTEDTRPHEAWDNMSGAPVQDLYRYDLTYATFALALMADITPAWREGYSAVLSFLNDRMLEYWSFVDWWSKRGRIRIVWIIPK